AKDGSIYFPVNGAGWYWGPEVENLIRFFPRRSFEIEYGWVHPYNKDRPFQELIHDLYNKRQSLKAAGDQAEYVLKLGLNSMYGKFAQHLGARPFYCLPYAGYITSFTRAALYRAAMAAPRDIIGFATDGIL